MVSNVPVSSILIVSGLVLLSALVANRAKGMVLFGTSASWAVAVCAAVLLIAGLVLHFESPSTEREMAGVIIRPPVNEKQEFHISFEPKKAVWGQQVYVKVQPSVDQTDIYLNDNPLPSVPKGGGVFAVTIPTISKSGYFMVSIKGIKIKASEELTVSAR